MLLTRRSLAALACLVFPACAPPGDAARGDTGAAAQGATGAAAVTRDPGGVAAGPVALLDAGPWERALSCSHGQCVSEYHFWADLAVENRSPDKVVGVRWTRDGWATERTALAAYEGTQPDGRERWGVDVGLGTGTQRPGEVQYAAFATMAGATYEDPDNVHYVYTGVTPGRPVRLLEARVDYVAGAGAVLAGSARGLRAPGEATRVVVRSSADGWATFRDTPATFAGDAWSFRVEGLGADPLPDGVEFALRLEGNGFDAWDNDGGRNYRRRLRPRFAAEQSYADDGEGLSGVLRFGAAFATDLAERSIAARLDGGPWQPGPSLALSTDALADGPHRVEFRAEYGGGFAAQDGVTFRVRNRVRPLEAWAPPAPSADDPSPWDFAADPAGRLFVLWPLSEGGLVTRHARFGDAGPPAVLAAPRGRSVAADAAGRLYVLSEAALRRFDPGGAPDLAFGVGGSVPLDGAFDGLAICYAGFLAAGAAGVDVVDTCNDRLLRFGDDGAFVGAAALPGAGQGGFHFGGVTADASGLWVFQPERLALFAAGGAPALDAAGSVPFAGDLGFANRQSVARAADGGFWLLDNDRLFNVSPEGALRGRWLGGAGQSSLPGAIGVARKVERLGDGSVVVLAADRDALQRFAAELRP
jgi:hypothetical protein